MKIFLMSDRPAVAVHSRPDITTAATIVSKNTGILVKFTQNGPDANIGMAFTDRHRYGEILDMIPMTATERIPDLKRQANGTRCYATTFRDGRHVITGAVVLIGTDLSAFDRRRCVYEEMVQLTGLLADHCAYQPSIFCEDDRQTFLPTEADRVLLRTLYDPRLRPGMTRAEAMPIAREIIRELWRE